MILDEYVEVMMTGANCSYYKSKGYNGKYRTKELVSISDLSPCSHIIVNVVCDNCGIEKRISYEYYNNNTKNGTRPYFCNKCKNIRIQEVCLERYGYKTPSQSPEYLEKVKTTCAEKYGCEHHLMSKNIRSKIVKSLSINNEIKTSAQQRYLNQLYGGELNYPCDFYSLDVFLPEYKLDIEYDGGGHNLAVKRGEISQEEFNQKEIIRGKYVRSKGYKQMRIISPHDHLPSDKVLNDMLNETTTFLLTTNHTWIEWYVEEGKYKDATGTYDYDYGELITKRQLYSKLNEEIPEQSSDCSF